jgi:hypothetical protein
LHGNTSQIDRYLSEVAVVFKASIASKASMTNERKTLVDGVHTNQRRIAEIDDEFQLTPVAHILGYVHEIAGCLHKDIEEGLARLAQRPYSRGMIDVNANFNDITSTLTENVFTRIKDAADKYLAPVKPGARMQRGQTVSFSSVPTTYDGEQTRTTAGATDELTTAAEAQHLDQERIQQVTRSTNSPANKRSSTEMGPAVKPTKSAAKKAKKGLKALSAAAAARAVDLKKADEVQQQAVQVGAAMDHLDDRNDAHANSIHNIHQLNGTSPAAAAAREDASKALREAETTTAAMSRDVTAPDATTTESEKAPPNSELAPVDAEATITLAQASQATGDVRCANEERLLQEARDTTAATLQSKEVDRLRKFEETRIIDLAEATRKADLEAVDADAAREVAIRIALDKVKKNADRTKRIGDAAAYKVALARRRTVADAAAAAAAAAAACDAISPDEDMSDEEELTLAENRLLTIVLPPHVQAAKVAFEKTLFKPSPSGRP